MNSYGVNDYAAQPNSYMAMGVSAEESDDYQTSGKRQYPQSRSKSDVIIEDPRDIAQNPSHGYTGSRRKAEDSQEFIHDQRTQLRRISELPVAGVVKKFDPNEKNWAQYDDSEEVARSEASIRGKSRSLFNHDIQGSKPKVYGGIGSAAIVNSFAGAPTGLKSRLQEKEAPWGVGGNFDTSSYGKKWLDKTDKGSKSGSVRGERVEPKAMENNPYQQPQRDALDQERERLESQGAQQREYEEYLAYQKSQTNQPQYEDQNYGQQQQYQEALQEPTKKGMSYMEQKKEELRRYQESQQQNYGSSTQPQNYQQEDENTQAHRRQDMEEALANEMKKMNLENGYGQDPQNEYQDRHALHDYNRAQDAPSKPTKGVPAGGVSIRKQSEDNKFTLSGYNDKEMMNQSKKSGHSVYETSSGSYGNYDMNTMGKVLNGRNSKVHGIKTPGGDMGYNVITGEFRG